MRKVLSNPFIYVAILAIAVFICFGRTLGSYFLADDFGEVAYVSKIFEGDYARLWSNFTGNYMQVPSMAVYRPWLLMTLFFDYAIWKTNAFGFYLTNLLHYLACTVLIFALVKLLTGYWGKLRSNLAATFSGLLFAFNPLHCESVSWVVGRVDIVCLTYYLLGLVSVALYVRSENKKWLILTFASFWLGILTKEMAIALPVTATLLALLWRKPGGSTGDMHTQKLEPAPLAEWDGTEGSEFATPGPPPLIEPSRATAIAALQKLDQELHSTHAVAASAEDLPATPQTAAAAQPAVTKAFTPASTQPSTMERIRFAMPVAAMLFVCTVVYFIIRYSCLGTITGGYTGSIGDSQISGILQKWTDLDTISRILFPLNQFVFGNDTIHKTVLTVLYLALTAIATARLIVGATPRRWLFFIFMASLTSLAPIYQLWGVGYNLEGSRFVFFLTVPLSMLFPILLFAPLERKPDAVEKSPANKLLDGASAKMLALSVIALFGLTAAYAKITMKNNVPWVHAGKQTEAITMKAQQLSTSTPNGTLVCVVGIPKDEGGAHMILNGTTFRHLITPPFAKVGLTGKILTFEPVLFGNPEKIDTAHFKLALKKPNVRAFYVWNMEKRDFIPFNPGASPAIPQAFEIPLATGAQPEVDQGDTAVLKGSLASFPYTKLRGDIDSSGSVENADLGFGLRLSGLKLRPAAFDYLSIEATMPADAKFQSDTCKISIEATDGNKTDFEAKFTADATFATGPSSTSEATSQNATSIRIPLSAYWRYYTAGEISSIVVDLPPVEKLKVKSIELLPVSMLAPAVTPVGRDSSNDGAFAVDRRIKTRPVGAARQTNLSPDVAITVDGRNLPGATAIEVQVLRKNFFFDNLATAQALASGTEATIRSNGNIATVNLPAKAVSSNGYVQLRARCLDSSNRQIGEYSYPITLRVLND
jgi:hypothetical protein